VQSFVAVPDHPEVVQMCHEWRMRKWRDERFDEELQYLLDEQERPAPPTPVLEDEPDEEPDTTRIEAGART
jgi:hypothetical protein